jgi:hypothetical protein
MAGFVAPPGGAADGAFPACGLARARVSLRAQGEIYGSRIPVEVGPSQETDIKGTPDGSARSVPLARGVPRSQLGFPPRAAV